MHLFLSGYKRNYNYYMRTIPDIDKLLRKVDEVVLPEFIPAIKGGIIITENERKLSSLAPQLRGLDVPIFEELCKIEYQNSIMTSGSFVIALLINLEDMNQVLNLIIRRRK